MRVFKGWRLMMPPLHPGSSGAHVNQEGNAGLWDADGLLPSEDIFCGSACPAFPSSWTTTLNVAGGPTIKYLDRRRVGVAQAEHQAVQKARRKRKTGSTSDPKYRTSNLPSRGGEAKGPIGSVGCRFGEVAAGVEVRSVVV